MTDVVSEEDKAAREGRGQVHGFYAEFGAVLKEGLGEDFANRDKLAKLLRFASTTGGHADAWALPTTRRA